VVIDRGYFGLWDFGLRQAAMPVPLPGYPGDETRMNFAGGEDEGYFGSDGRRFDSCHGFVPCSSVVEHRTNTVVATFPGD